MKLTEKERSLLKDLKAEEQLCVEKYAKYAADAEDTMLSNLFDSIGRTEQEHLDTISVMMEGGVPTMKKGGRKKQAPPTGNRARKNPSQQDGYLCADALSTEKHVSSVYDTSVFEFAQPELRSVLNHIQGEEQGHGKQIYDYMSSHGLYNA